MIDYKKYMEEIEYLKKIHNLTAVQIATLQLAASFEVGDFNYQDLKELFIKLNKEEVLK